MADSESSSDNVHDLFKDLVTSIAEVRYLDSSVVPELHPTEAQLTDLRNIGEWVKDFGAKLRKIQRSVQACIDEEEDYWHSLSRTLEETAWLANRCNEWSHSNNHVCTVLTDILRAAVSDVSGIPLDELDFSAIDRVRDIASRPTEDPDDERILWAQEVMTATLRTSVCTGNLLICYERMTPPRDPATGADDLLDTFNKHKNFLEELKRSFDAQLIQMPAGFEHM